MLAPATVRFTALFALLLVASAPAVTSAQTHTQSQTHHGTATHHATDSTHHVALQAHHDAMHALMNGTWEGTFSSPHSISSPFTLTIAHDSGLVMTIKMGADQPLTAGAATNFTHDGQAMKWTQMVSGRSCSATMTMEHGSDAEKPKLVGTIKCADGDLEFTLQKKGG